MAADWQDARKAAYDQSLRAQAEAQWVTIPVSEFENLHEQIRLLRLRVEQLQGMFIEMMESRGE